MCWFMNGILSCPNRQFRMHFCIIAICTTLEYYTYKRFLFERMNNTNFWKQLQLTLKCIYIFASCVQKTKESNIWIINLHNLVRLKLSTSTQDLHFSLKTKLNKAFPTKRGGIFWFTRQRHQTFSFLPFQSFEFWKSKSCFL